jgi:hypothetical protein
MAITTPRGVVTDEVFQNNLPISIAHGYGHADASRTGITYDTNLTQPPSPIHTSATGAPATGARSLALGPERPLSAQTREVAGRGEVRVSRVQERRTRDRKGG